MSQFMKVGLDQARAAKDDLSRKLLGEFSLAAGGPVNSIDIGRVSTAEHCVDVILARAATKHESEKLPVEHMGVKVRYQVGPRPVMAQ